MGSSSARRRGFLEDHHRGRCEWLGHRRYGRRSVGRCDHAGLAISKAKTLAPHHATATRHGDGQRGGCPSATLVRIFARNASIELFGLTRRQCNSTSQQRSPPTAARAPVYGTATGRSSTPE